MRKQSQPLSVIWRNCPVMQSVRSWELCSTRNRTRTDGAWSNSTVQSFQTVKKSTQNTQCGVSPFRHWEKCSLGKSDFLSSVISLTDWSLVTRSLTSSIYILNDQLTWKKYYLKCLIFCYIMLKKLTKLFESSVGSIERVRKMYLRKFHFFAWKDEAVSEYKHISYTSVSSGVVFTYSKVSVTKLNGKGILPFL